MAEVDVRPGIDAQNPQSISPPTPQKRRFDEVDHTTTTSNNISNDNNNNNGDDPHVDEGQASSNRPRESTPMTSSSSSSLSPPPSSPDIPETTNHPDSSSRPPNHTSPTLTAVVISNPSNISTPDPMVNPNKKRKLSPASKEAMARQRLEEKAKKEEARRIKEEEKKKREEEKEAERRIKEEEKKKRDEEKEEERRLKEEERKKREGEKEEERKKREEKRKQKEEEKQAREEEKRKKEEDKMKKERSQMKLNAFFAKPVKPAKMDSSSKKAEVSTSSAINTASENNASNTRHVSDYEHDFPPFFVQSHVKLGPSHRFERDTNSLAHARQRLDESFKALDSGAALSRPFNPSELFQLIPYKRLQGKLKVPSVKEIMAPLQDSNCIDLTDPKQAIDATTRARKRLDKVQMKVFRFAEDVRPPYQGTFTKPLSEQAARKLCRNPFLRGVSDINYDYDSEAEWEEPEEGEDIGTEGEDEVSDDGEDDMDDFLDDAEDGPTTAKRRMVVGDLEPVCSGIRWAEDTTDDALFKQYRMEMVSGTLNFPIDPFSDSYWKPPTTTQQNKPPFKMPNRNPSKNTNPTTTNGPQSHTPHNQSLLSKGTALQSPVTYPATTTTTINSKLQNPTTTTSTVISTSQKPRGQFPPDRLSEFKEVVSGSNLTKAGLVEVLKKRFPKSSKDIIKETLTATAIRQGQKEVDKKWVLL